MGRIIAKIWEIKCSGQKLITVPKDSDMKPGDLVEIVPLELVRKEDKEGKEIRDRKAKEKKDDEELDKFKRE